MRSCFQAVFSGKGGRPSLRPGWALTSQGPITLSSSLISHRWQFSSDGGDIGFGVFLKTKMGERQKAGEMTEVLPSQRYNAHMVPEDGSLTCAEAGVCKSIPAVHGLRRQEPPSARFKG